MADKKKALTPEQLADAKRLHAIYEKTAKISQEKFGEQYELGTQGLVWQYLNGRIPLNLEAAIKFAEGLNCDVAEFSPRLAELLTKGRRADQRLNQYEIPDHMLHQLLGDFQQLGRAKRLELLHQLSGAVAADRTLAARGVKTDYPTDKETERALRLSPSRLHVEPRTPKRRSGQLALFKRKT